MYDCDDPYLMHSEVPLGSIGIDCVISESCCRGTILQRNYYRKMAILWSFSYNSFVKFHDKKFVSHNMTRLYFNPCYGHFAYNPFVKLHGKKFVSHNMTMLYSNLCYNEVCYKRIELFLILTCNNEYGE